MIKIKEMIPLKKLFLPMMIFLILASCLCFASDYPFLCSSDQQCDSGNNKFNAYTLENATQIDVYLNGAKSNPLATDLDGDGSKEIIVLDSFTFKVYQNSTLDFITSYGVSGSNVYSNVWIQDINNDGFKDIMVNTDGDIHILNYYGSNNSLSERTSFSVSPSGISMIACTDYGNRNEQCASVGHTNAAPMLLISQGFNWTGVHDTLNYQHASDSVGATKGRFCYSMVPIIVVDDINYDGKKEFVFSAFNLRPTSGGLHNYAYLSAFQFYNSSTLKMIGINNNKTVSIDLGQMVGGSEDYNSCIDSDLDPLFANAGKLITSPLIADIGDEFGKETFFCYPTTGNVLDYCGAGDGGCFKCRAYDGNLNLVSTFPSTAIGSITSFPGNSLSNLFRANIFEGDTDSDVCVIGYNSPYYKNDFISCMSLRNTQTYLFVDINAFTYTVPDKYYMYNQSVYEVLYNSPPKLLAHSAHVTTLGDFDSQDQIVYNKGIFYLERGSSYLGDSDQIWYSSGMRNMSIILDDYGNTAYSQMILSNINRLSFISDSEFRSGGYVSNVSVQPCNPAQNGTTVRIGIKLADDDGDLVTGGIEYFYGSVNQQSWNLTDDTGQIVNTTGWVYHNFVANSTGFGVIRVHAMSTDFPSQIFYYSDPTLMEVTSGVGYKADDCIRFIDPLPEGEDPGTGEGAGSGDTPDGSSGDNAVFNGVDILAELFGLSRMLVWLVFMLICGLGVVYFVWKNDGSMKTVGIVFSMIEAILLVIGWILQMVPTYLVVIIVIVFVSFMAVEVMGFFLGQKQGG